MAIARILRALADKLQLERRGALELPALLDFPLPGLLGFAPWGKAAASKTRRKALEAELREAEQASVEVVKRLGLLLLTAGEQLQEARLAFMSKQPLSTQGPPPLICVHTIPERLQQQYSYCSSSSSHLMHGKGVSPSALNPPLMSRRVMGGGHQRQRGHEASSRPSSRCSCRHPPRPHRRDPILILGHYHQAW